MKAENTQVFGTAEIVFSGPELMIGGVVGDGSKPLTFEEDADYQCSVIFNFSLYYIDEWNKGRK